MQVGYHPPMRPGKNPYLDAIVRAHEQNNATAIQIWTGGNKTYNYKMHPPNITQPIKEYVEKNNIFLISHSPYILNFVRNDQRILDRYIADLKNIHNMGGRGSVLHMGFNVKSLKMSHEKACKIFVKNLHYVAKRTPKESIIILENMAGKGTAMCCRMDEWAEFCSEYIDGSLRKRVKWCVDTAHLHGVGEYNLSMRREVDRFYDDFDGLIGWDQILCFHFNGSSAKLGSCKDLHADIGYDWSGLIETKGMRHLARYAWESKKPMIMEIPAVESSPLWQIELAKSWVDKKHIFRNKEEAIKFVDFLILKEYINNLDVL